MLYFITFFTRALWSHFIFTRNVWNLPISRLLFNVEVMAFSSVAMYVTFLFICMIHELRFIVISTSTVFRRKVFVINDGIAGSGEHLGFSPDPSLELIWSHPTPTQLPSLDQLIADLYTSSLKLWTPPGKYDKIKQTWDQLYRMSLLRYYAFRGRKCIPRRLGNT